MIRGTRRNLLETKIDILKTINRRNEVGITNIMYAANLDNTKLKNLLEQFIMLDVIRSKPVGKRIYYTITLKGQKIIELWELLQTELTVTPLTIEEFNNRNKNHYTW